MPRKETSRGLTILKIKQLNEQNTFEDVYTLGTEDEEKNLFFLSFLVDNNNSQVTKKEVEKWEKGNLVLYSRNLRIEILELINPFNA